MASVGGTRFFAGAQNDNPSSLQNDNPRVFTAWYGTTATPYVKQTCYDYMLTQAFC